ncbi:MAG: hypothetical protein V5A64_03395 [Candidatus Thermoplasmatota archaeon]
MLKNKKKEKNDLEDYKENIQSMRSWVRKIEQSTDSLSSRLKAVEKRISLREDNVLISNDSAVKHRDLLEDLGKEISDEKIMELNRLIEEDLFALREDVIFQQDEINEVKAKLEGLNTTIKEIKNLYSKKEERQKKTIDGLDDRLNKIESHTPFTMSIKNWEIPVEIAGFICGVLAFSAAFLVFFEMESFLVSPIFLFLIGGVFFVAGFFKTAKVNGWFKKYIKGKNRQGLTGFKPVNKIDNVFEEK